MAPTPGPSRPLPSHPGTPDSVDSRVEGLLPNSTDASNHGVRRSIRSIPRGHSDGDLLASVMGPYTRTQPEERVVDSETWQDFLRQVPVGEQDAQERARAAVRRAAMVAADRKRRFMGQHEDYTRRRSVSTLSSGQATRDRMRQTTATLGSDNLFPTVKNDLVASIDTNRPLPRTPSTESPQHSGNGDVVLPRWQADSEVSECPICGRSFSFWFRKHHCRKCGRVVCASCSPHRITIPRQFIVHPPEEPDSGMFVGSSSNIETVDLTEDDNEHTILPDASTHSLRRRSRNYRLDPALGGGQEVRLCNPCVPDPNPLPPPSYSIASPHGYPSFSRPENLPLVPQPPRAPVHRSSASLQTSLLPPHSSPIQHCSQVHYGLEHSSSSRPRSLQSSLGTTTGATLGPASQMRLPGIPIFPPSLLDTAQPSAGQRSSSTGRRHMNFSQPTRAPPLVPPRNPAAFGSAPGSSSQERHLESFVQSHRSILHQHRQHASTSNVPVHSPYRSMLDLETPLPRPRQQTQVREEDECPICHMALPPKGVDGSEVERETHVVSCIETHFSSSAPRNSHPPPGLAVAAAVAANSATPSQAGAGIAPAPVSRLEASQGVSSPLVQRRRTTGMVVYHASEKDCVGEDGEGAQECVICFEEFAVGDEMGRLECLCKFHKVCIRQWWDTKGPGACPVHQGGI